MFAPLSSFLLNPITLYLSHTPYSHSLSTFLITWTSVTQYILSHALTFLLSPRANMIFPSK